MSADVGCPGCGLSMPRRETATYHGYYNASPECWLVYTEVLASEYGNAVLFVLYGVGIDSELMDLPVWNAWSEHHDEIAKLVSLECGGLPPL